MRSLLLAGALLAATLWHTDLVAQQALPLGTTAQSLLSFDESSTFTYDAPDAGFLSVILRADAGEDLSFVVTDGEGQTLPEGHADMDRGGNVGDEQLVVSIPRRGRYHVVVRSLSGGPASFQIGGAFLTSQLAASPEDPDGTPSTGLALAVGASHEDAIHPSQGDRWDWYRIQVDQSGVLTILTRGTGDGDLRLEVFEEGAFSDPVNASDQDQDGVLANESLTVNVKTGQTVYVRVIHPFSGTERVAYRLASGLIPG